MWKNAGSFQLCPSLPGKMLEYSPVPQLPQNAENDDDNICSSPLNIGEKCRQQSIMPLVAPKMLAYAPVLQPLKNAENNASIIRSGLITSCLLAHSGAFHPRHNNAGHASLPPLSVRGFGNSTHPPPFSSPLPSLPV